MAKSKEAESEAPVAVADEQQQAEVRELHRKVEVAVKFLEWLADYTKGDFSLRTQVVKCLREMGCWNR